ncbi:MAG: hypothetical protein U1C51_04435, partial [Candidatus Izemoplasmatales bacterium]|nr:hypothetical protein [Candidatus Izemoplasmatales bacterium]
MTLQDIYLLIISLTSIIVLLMVLILVNKWRIRTKKRRITACKTALMEQFSNKKKANLRLYALSTLMESYVSLAQSLVLDEEQRGNAYQDFSKMGIIKRLVKQLSHRHKVKRKEAIFLLGH